MEEMPNPYEDENLKSDFYGVGDYLQYSHFIDAQQIKLIVEVGSRDAIDAIRLGYFYKCPVFAFECNPQALTHCFYNVAKYPFVRIVPVACWNENKDISFYPVIQSHGGNFPVNIGASSCLVSRKDGIDNQHKQGTPISVQAVRLDTWMSENNVQQIDLLCMDCQGATLQVLQGLGEKINRVKYLISEVYLVPSFEGETLYPGIKSFLACHGFYPKIEPPAGTHFCDILFINKNLIHD
jgi:FkbM family methyltransferase